jgi:UDP:flavonoid glycosyltransferase YjiC (YdhE family)
MRFLLIPENNSVSHVSKCLSINEALAARGHECFVAVSQGRASFLRSLGIDHLILPDIQENDGAGFPTVEWFRRPQRIVECIKAEIDVMQKIKPDRVLGVFRFTLKASAQVARIPYDSLICGCMMPEAQAVLGFADGEPELRLQEYYLNTFFNYAAKRTSQALAAFGLDVIRDIREMLKGERTFLWDFPEFMPFPRKHGFIHVGPISCDKWPYDPVDITSDPQWKYPLAVIATGTCMANVEITERIIGVLLDLGYHVVVASGGQKELAGIMPHESRVTTCLFAPLKEIFPYASLVVSHGGQMTIFEALQSRVPVVVIPFHPEQAHNGVCLERMGCGRRLVPPQPFRGDPSVYSEALNRMTDEEIKANITKLINDPQTAKRLTEAQSILAGYGGTGALIPMLEEG